MTPAEVAIVIGILAIVAAWAVVVAVLVKQHDRMAKAERLASEIADRLGGVRQSLEDLLLRIDGVAIYADAEGYHQAVVNGPVGRWACRGQPTLVQTDPKRKPILREDGTGMKHARFSVNDFMVSDPPDVWPRRDAP